MATTTDALYDLEFRASEEDDAWYSVCVVFDAAAESLTVKYMCDPQVYEAKFFAADFKTEARLEELLDRFRPVSRQLQDDECLQLSVGTSVCASHGTGDDDLRFFDAVVDAVERRTHSFVGGEEECLCNFVLYWQHGRGRGTLTSASIAGICLLQPATQIDPRIRAFTEIAKEKMNSSKSNSVVPKLEPLESCLTNKTEASPKMSNYNQWTSCDDDLGPNSCNVDGSATTDGHIFILIDNLEKDLTPSSIESFIYEKTTVLPEAFVFPRHLSDPFARGAILVDCEKKAQTIYEFLDNPNHLVVSSRGRPWVITEKVMARTFGANIWNLIPATRQGELTPRRPRGELDVVFSGTDSYKRALQLRNLFIEFINHESHVIKRLVLEEKKITVADLRV